MIGKLAATRPGPKSVIDQSRLRVCWACADTTKHIRLGPWAGEEYECRECGALVNRGEVVQLSKAPVLPSEDSRRVREFT